MSPETFSEDQVLEELKIDRDNVDEDRRLRVLDSQFLRQWFLQRGYTLYFGWKREVNGDIQGYEPQASSEYDENVRFPYAFHGGDDEVDNWSRHPPLFARCAHRVIYAQDAQLRHVAIKIVKDGSHEYEILRFLFEQETHDTMSTFNHVIPVLEMIPFGELWFVVMPRWGDCYDRPFGPQMKHILHAMRDLLKGLAYLHKNRICHGDISYSNILVNHFARESTDYRNPDRVYFKQKNLLTYALYDFDLATKFPPSWSDQQCRLPYYKSWHGTPGFVPPDTWQGEFDFDPFARDVGSLGLVFTGIYFHLTAHVPLLAPLFDKMSTRDVPKRFTAQQALGFLEDVVIPRTPPAQLDVKVEERPPESPGWWDGLDPIFIQEWAAYREPPLPRTTKMLRFICEYPWILHTVAFLRKTIFRLRRSILLRSVFQD